MTSSMVFHVSYLSYLLHSDLRLAFSTINCKTLQTVQVLQTSGKVKKKKNKQKRQTYDIQ